MNKIPIVNKTFIQSSYVNYIVLTRLRGELSKFKSIGQWCFWGGITLFAVWCFHQIFEQFSYGLSPGVCIVIFIIGAFIRSESMPKILSYSEEMRRIENEMKEIDVIFSRLGDEISVYHKKITENDQFNPLSDSAYTTEMQCKESYEI